ncbi:MAG: hypothetical protein II709_05415 [Ruminococcus sp.]|nr:hypothetical protein [Ruminococcus sp.]
MIECIAEINRAFEKIDNLTLVLIQKYAVRGIAFVLVKKDVHEGSDIAVTAGSKSVRKIVACRVEKHMPENLYLRLKIKLVRNLIDLRSVPKLEVCAFGITHQLKENVTSENIMALSAVFIIRLKRIEKALGKAFVGIVGYIFSETQLIEKAVGDTRAVHKPDDDFGQLSAKIFISEIDDPVNDLLGFERYIGKTGFIVFVQKAVLYTKLFGNIIGIFTHPFHSFPYLLKQLYHVRARSFPKFSVTFIIFAPLSAENKTGWSQTHPV